MNVVRYWAVFSLGVAAGAAAALIYAPQTGEKTRKQLKRNLQDASDYIQDTTGDLGKHATRVYKKTKRRGRRRGLPRRVRSPATSAPRPAILPIRLGTWSNP